MDYVFGILIKFLFGLENNIPVSACTFSLFWLVKYVKERHSHTHM